MNTRRITHLLTIQDRIKAARDSRPLDGLTVSLEEFRAELEESGLAAIAGELDATLDDVRRMIGDYTG